MVKMNFIDIMRNIRKKNNNKTSNETKERKPNSRTEGKEYNFCKEWDTQYIKNMTKEEIHSERERAIYQLVIPQSEDMYSGSYLITKEAWLRNLK